MSAPDWLLQQLRDANPDGVMRGARLGRCERCHAQVLRGLDDERCAGVAVCDLTPLDHFGEYLALTQGRRTFSLARRASAGGSARWEIDWRAHWHIANSHRRYPIVAAHRCGLALPTAATSPFQRLAPIPEHVDPPF